MHVVIAPDSMGGVLSAADVAAALAFGWGAERPDDTVTTCPLSDGGEGLLAVVAGPHDRHVDVEVAGPLGHPATARVLLRPDGTAVVESAQACGLHLVPAESRDPMRATTWGVGQLLDAAREAGASRVLVGLGGSATVDGGAGALGGLGYRVTVADGSGLKVGGADLPRAAAIEPGWVDPGWADVEVVLLADVRTHLADAARRFGPQKGATPEVVDQLADALAAWADVVERDLDATGLRDQDGTGAAGGLGFALAAALDGRIVPGIDAVLDLVGFGEQLAAADVVVTGEGRLDATSFEGKVVGEVVARGNAAGVTTALVAGRVALDAETESPIDATSVETVPSSSAGEAEAALQAAGRRLARRLGT